MKRKIICMCLSAAMVVANFSCVMAAEDTAPDLKDDFWGAVNYEELKSTEIPEDKSEVGTLETLGSNAGDAITEIIQEVSEKENLEKGSDEANIAALCKTRADQETRDKEGYGSVLNEFLQRMEQTETPEELMKECLEFAAEYGVDFLGGISYEADQEDSTKKATYLRGASSGLGREIWESDNEVNQKLVEMYEEYLQKLMKAGGDTQEQAETEVEQAVTVMKKLASASLLQQELYDPTLAFQAKTGGDLAEAFGGTVPAETWAELFDIHEEDTVYFYQSDMIAAEGELLIEENMDMLKAYVKALIYTSFATYADTESSNVAYEFYTASEGLEKQISEEKKLRSEIQDILGMECGRLYCDRYFSEETCTDVENMIEEVKEVYKNRLQSCQWLGDDTRKEAIKKLDNLRMLVGGPKEWPQDEYDLELKTPEEGGSYIGNVMETQRVVTENAFSKRKDPVDKDACDEETPPQSANAYYNSSANSITILAGVLQDPAYSPDNSEEQNLGMIGMIIGHEITHAFDNNGGLYDMNGNVKNWWTDEDREQFDKLSQKVIDYYNTMEIEGNAVNGELTVSENIADLGSLSCITEVAKDRGYDLKKVYESFARLWFDKQREENLIQQLTSDVHSPAKIRVNAVLSAIPEFYETYDIQEGDGMYVAPEERPAVW